MRRQPDAEQAAIQRVRCAIYTRKSTDENLDSEFNSLDVQREAGEAYVTSQRHEGSGVMVKWLCRRAGPLRGVGSTEALTAAMALRRWVMLDAGMA